MIERLIQAVVTKVYPHLGHGYTKGAVVAMWTQTSQIDGSTMYRICREDGRCDRLLTLDQAQESLRTRRDNRNAIIRFSEGESKRIKEAHWFDLTR